MSALARRSQYLTQSLARAPLSLSSRSCISAFQGSAHRSGAPKQRRAAQHIPIRAVATTDRSTSSTSSTMPPAVATLPSTTKNFPIPAEKLIEKAKQVCRADSGVNDLSLLAVDFGAPWIACWAQGMKAWFPYLSAV